MERRKLGKTGLEVSTLGFGCGNVGGLMIRGTPAEQERAVARALELGINYFDTAPAYGDGESEQNLGRVLRTLRAPVLVGTKFRIEPADQGRVGEAVAASLEASLRRLQMKRVDLLQLHNLVAADGAPGTLSARLVLEEVVPALERLRRAGKIRFLGITALGETAALHRVVGARVLDTAQVCYNLLNPSAGVAVPPGYPAQDFAGLLDRARETATGVIGIRALAAGTLSGVESRHPIAAPSVDPIASGPDYAADVRRARGLAALVKEGHAGSVIEAALRFAIGHAAVSTVLVGYSSLDQLEYAARCVEKGPLPPAALERLAALRSAFASESGSR
ncbi:MAG: aldo/keto reductase [Candidatus Rokubacteria bacterium]|nr:aldo/keto reductase [Candidatus Rokubacteria bacterium]